MTVPVKDPRWKTAAVPDDARVEESLQSIEQDIKNIRHHLHKPGPKRPLEDMGTLFQDISSISMTMYRRIDRRDRRVEP